MKSVTISINWSNLLRDTIDSGAHYKRNVDIAEFKRKLKEDNLSKEEKEELIQNTILSLSLKDFLNAKEGLVIPDDTKHKQFAQLIKDMPIDLTLHYEDFYAYQLIDKLDEIVSRAFKVRDLFAKAHPPENIKRLCYEAYQCYLYGYHTASIIVIRSLVEAALKDRLSCDTGELRKLNDMGLESKLYQKNIWHKIDRIRNKANKFVHTAVSIEPPSEKENLDLLAFAQEVLQVLIT